MLQVNFIMICIIRKISVLLKITRIMFFREINRHLSFSKKITNFFTTYNDGKFKSQGR